MRRKILVLIISLIAQQTFAAKPLPGQIVQTEKFHVTVDASDVCFGPTADVQLGSNSPKKCPANAVGAVLLNADVEAHLVCDKVHIHDCIGGWGDGVVLEYRGHKFWPRFYIWLQPSMKNLAERTIVQVSINKVGQPDFGSLLWLKLNSIAGLPEITVNYETRTKPHNYELDFVIKRNRIARKPLSVEAITLWHSKQVDRNSVGKLLPILQP